MATLPDLGIRAAALAAAGPAIGLVARWPSGTADQLASLTMRLVSLAEPPMSAVLVSGRPDIAAACGAHGVILRRDDLDASDARGQLTIGSWILRSVHGVDEADAAIRDGAQALILGNVWPTRSHPERTAAGIDLFRDVAAMGVPTFAIGGVTVERVAAVREAGGYGVAAITALWFAPQPYHAARTMLQLLTN